MFTKVAVAAAIVSTVSAITISTPASLIVCQPAAINWSGSSSNTFYLAAIPAAQPTAAALANIATTSSSPYAWTVNLAAGTNITLKITDGNGDIAYSSPVVIQSGASTSCLSSSAASGSASGSAAASGTASASGSAASAGASGSMSASKSASGTASGSASGSASAASASTSKAAAGKNAIVGGALAVAGLMAAVVAA